MKNAKDAARDIHFAITIGAASLPVVTGQVSETNLGARIRLTSLQRSPLMTRRPRTTHRIAARICNNSDRGSRDSRQSRLTYRHRASFDFLSFFPSTARTRLYRPDLRATPQNAIYRLTLVDISIHGHERYLSMLRAAIFSATVPIDVRHIDFSDDR